MDEQRSISKISVRINCAVAEVMKDDGRIQGVSGLQLRKQWLLSGTSCSERTQTVDTNMNAVIPDAMSPR
jgi:hypothetical protein